MKILYLSMNENLAKQLDFVLFTIVEKFRSDPSSNVDVFLTYSVVKELDSSITEFRFFELIKMLDDDGYISYRIDSIDNGTLLPKSKGLKFKDNGGYLNELNNLRNEKLIDENRFRKNFRVALSSMIMALAALITSIISLFR
jgi:hypothetical protein